MNELKIFQNEEFAVRAVTVDGQPYFVGRDVAAILGYKNPQEAVRNHVDQEDKGVSEILTPGGYIPTAPGMSDMEILSRAIQISQATIERQKQQLEAQAPKVLFADSVAASDNTILINDLAKLLHQNGVDIGGTRLFQWMQENGYLIRRKGTDYNMPTQRSMELGLFRIKETTHAHSDGHISISRTPKVTGKGQQYFVEKFLSVKQ